MLGPDDNSPTIPDRQAVRPGAAGNNAPYDWPDATNDGGKPPVWDLPAAPKPAPGQRGAGGFGLGFGLALIVLAAMALGLIVVLSLTSKGGLIGQQNGLTPQPSPTATQNALTPTATPPAPVTGAQATDIANQYYTDINGGAFQDAYNLLGNGLQQQIGSVDQLRQQWANTASVEVDPASIQAQSNPDNTAQVLLNYQWAQARGDVAQSSLFQATLTVGYEQGQLHILTLAATDITPSPTPVPTDTPQPTDTPSPDVTPVP